VTALGFDFTQIDPNFGGGGFLPVSDERGWLVVLTADNGFKAAQSGQGMYLELVGKGQDQAVANQEFALRLNLQHTNPQAIQAAYSQLAALGLVCGLQGRVNDTSELFNKPFRVVSVKQKDSEYTQLANNGIRDVNGNKPGKFGQGPQQSQPAPQQFGGSGQGGGFPPQGQGQPGGFQPQGQPPQGQATQPGQGGGPVGTVQFGQGGTFQQSQQQFDPNTGQAPGFAPQGQNGGFQQQPNPGGFGGAPQGGPAPFGGNAPQGQGGAPGWALQPGR